MRTASLDRIDPSSLSNEDRASLDKLSQLVFREERPALVGRDSTVRIELPDPIFHLLVKIVQAMRQNKAFVLFPESESLTTQAGADCLGVSRPFFVEMLDRGTIPHHRVGTHRRVYLKDVLAYLQHRDRAGREALDKLNDRIESAGLYEKTLPADDARE